MRRWFTRHFYGKIALSLQRYCGRAPLASLGLALGLLLLAGASAQAQTTPSVSLWRVYFDGEEELAALAGRLDVWEVDHAAGWVLAPLDDTGLTQLQEQYRLARAPDQSRLSPLPGGNRSAGVQSAAPSTIPGFACYRTVAETYGDLRSLAETRPELARIVDIGDSWEKITGGDGDGHDLLALVLTNRRRTQPKFRFFLMGAIHARELVTAETAMRFAEQLVAGYGVDPVATYLLDYGELHLLPAANPDGRVRAEAGELWRKNTNDTASCTTDLPLTSFGVDLNRNSSFQWNTCFGCSSGRPCEETYRGAAPASEPETQAVESYVRSLFSESAGPWLNSVGDPARSGLFVSLHSYGELVLYPWGYTNSPAPDVEELRTLARKLGYYTGYRVCQAGANGCLYPTDGTTDDWAYGELGVPAYTIEQGTAFFQSCAEFESDILPVSLQALRYGFLAAAQPYHMPGGPEALALGISSDLDTRRLIGPDLAYTVTQPVTTRVSITLAADDSRSAGNGTGSDPAHEIVAGRIAVDALPWQSGTPVWALAPQESGSQTTLQGAVEATCLSNGRHHLIGQAQDSSGVWGVPGSQFLTVDHPRALQAAMDPPEHETVVGRPLTYTLTLTNTSAVTATYTISYAQDLANELAPPRTGGSQMLAFPTGVTLAPREPTAFPVTATPINNTAGTQIPTVLFIRNQMDATDCRVVQFTTAVTGATIRLPLLHK